MKFLPSVSRSAFHLGLGAFLAYLAWTGSNLQFGKNPNISPADFIAIILTALGVILAALAIFLGGMALVSWRLFDERVKAHAEDFLERRFSHSDQRYADLVEMLRDDARREAQFAREDKADIENLSGFDEAAL